MVGLLNYYPAQIKISLQLFTQSESHFSLQARNWKMLDRNKLYVRLRAGTEVDGAKMPSMGTSCQKQSPNCPIFFQTLEGGGLLSPIFKAIFNQVYSKVLCVFHITTAGNIIIHLHQAKECCRFLIIKLTNIQGQ